MNVTTDRSDVIHSINPGTGKSWCGRVVKGGDGVKVTRKPVTCGRDIQLSAKHADTPATPVKAVKAGTDTPKPRKTAVHAAQKAAGDVVTADVRPPQPRKARGTADTTDHFSKVVEFLDHNDLKTENVDGALVFAYGDWIYSVRKDDDNWSITYAERDADQPDDGYTEEFSTDDGVIGWIVKDTGLKRPAKKVGGRKVTPPKAAKVDNTSDAMIASHLVTAVSNISSAHGIALKAKDAFLAKALADLQVAADELRRIAASTK